ncbi:VOC family protein [Dyadobacter sp. CY326]|uniref:VOC family protein n=1 Tax=Dyadobacter sp. CY326 TaxID=2907300 RepID=UPI001F398185|nr:VOC family protein [Dyadobacter sp. CY326]MCE7067432.1 VOC family protein [Dyadobacter sp. CY326]
MKRHISLMSLLVEDYDEAISFYVQKLGFELLEDTLLTETKRWVRIAPNGAAECCLLLAKAGTEDQRACIGDQTGGRVFLFLNTDDFWRDYQNLVANGVQIIRQPSEEHYGTVAVFADLYGNLWDLIETKN